MSQSPIDLYGDPCRSCGYEWSTTDELLVEETLALESTYRRALAGLPGTARHPDLDWCASAYVLHVADNLRIHAERMAAGARGPEFMFQWADRDDLAVVRHYDAIPIEGALWSLDSVVGPYVEVFYEAREAGATLRHPDRGDQSASDVLRGNLHDAHHHAWDLRRIASAHQISVSSPTLPTSDSTS